MPEPLPVAVVIPAYNAASFLHDSLTSVAEQTARPAEVIVVDDGSTDDTAAIARAAGARVITQSNAGTGAARNVGIRAATSPWIALLDGDDRWHADYLASQWRAHLACPEVMLVASDYAFWTDGVVGPAILESHAGLRAAPRDEAAPGVARVTRTALLAVLARANFVLPSGLLVDRRVFVECGELYHARSDFPESPEVLVGEDYEWLLRALRHTDAVFVAGARVDYRTSPGSLSALRGRIRYGDVVLGEMIARHPERYVAGAAGMFARARPRALRDAVRWHLRGGEVEFARLRLRDLARCSPPPQRVAFDAVATLLGTPLGRRLARPLATYRR